MRPIIGEFNFTRLENVLYGPGKVATLVSRELAKRNAKRAVIVTCKTLGRSKLLDKVKDGGRLRDRGRVRGDLAARALEDGRGAGGGGAPSQGRFVHQLRRRHSQRYREGRGECDAGRQASRAASISIATPAPVESRCDFPEIAIPTTLSAGEFTPFAGMTQEETREKGGVGEPRLQAKAVILDPEVDAGDSGVAMGRHRDARARSCGRRRLLESA